MVLPLQFLFERLEYNVNNNYFPILIIIHKQNNVSESLPWSVSAEASVFSQRIQALLVRSGDRQQPHQTKHHNVSQGLCCMVCSLHCITLLYLHKSGRMIAFLMWPLSISEGLSACAVFRMSSSLAPFFLVLFNSLLFIADNTHRVVPNPNASNAAAWQ